MPALALSLLLLAATPGPKVASPGWTVVNVSPEFAAFSADQLADALRRQGLSVTTAADIATLLGVERQRQLMGCDTQSATCMAELANALGCDATLTVSLAKLGDEFRGVAKMMSSRDGSVLASARLDAKTEKELTDLLEQVAIELAKPLGGKGTAVPRVVTAPATRFVAPGGWWLPGAAGVLVGALGATFFGLAATKYAGLTDPTKMTEFSIASGFARDGSTFQALGWAFTSVGAAAVAGSLVWLLVGGHTETVQVGVLAAPGTLGWSLGGQF